MRKRLLMMAFAVLSVASSFAFEVGEYAYTSTQRFKITGENLVVTNGDFSDGLNGWIGADLETAPSADVWSVEEGAGPNGEKVVKSLGATADMPLCGVWDLESSKTYVVTIDVKFPTATNTGISTATSVAGNCVDFFLNTDGAVKKAESTESAPVVNVASSVYCPADEWKTLVFFIKEVGEGQKLVMHLEKLTTEAMFTKIEIHEAAEVYDIRPVLQQIAFAKQLMEDNEFNIAAAADAKGSLSDAIALIEGMIEAGELDDESVAKGVIDAAFVGTDVEPSLLEQFLKVSSTNMNSQIAGIDIPSLSKSSRGGYTGSANIAVTGGNWGHPEGTDYLMSAIQNGYDHQASITLSNADFPAGKYFFSAEMRNAKTGKDSWPCPGQTFDLETTCKAFVGATEKEITIVGEDYQRVAMWGEVDAAGQFKAGVNWPNTVKGGAFYIRNLMVRALGDPKAEIERKQAWDTFMAQWNAAIDRRNKLIAMIGDQSYPWRQDSLVRAKEKWDVFYNEVIEKGWINSECTDPGKNIVSNEELENWAKYQGGDIPEGGAATYQVVRGYDYAIKFVIAKNSPIADLKATIVDAEKTRDDDMNSNGDKKSYQTAIDNAQAVYDDVIANTNDEKFESDSTRIDVQIKALATAKEAFLKSAVLTPIVDIDFANNFELVQSDDAEYYVIKGAAGEMNFGVNVGIEDNKVAKQWAKGYGEELLDVIRVGNTDATVTLAEGDIPGDDDVLRINFDWWGGYLVKRKMIEVKLLNAAGEVVAGFLKTRGAETEYNDFNNANNEGMDLGKYSEIGSSSASNVAIKNDGTNKSSFDLIIDYKAQTLRGIINNAKNGISEGAVMPFRNDVTDHKIVKFAINSAYDNADRRSWFDNLKIYKYASQAEGPHQFGTLGDVNGDGKIDVEDVVAIVNKILGEPAENFLEAYADVNGDGKIDVEDVVATVNIILGGSDAAAAAPQLMNILLQNGFKF